MVAVIFYPDHCPFALQDWRTHSPSSWDCWEPTTHGWVPSRNTLAEGNHKPKVTPVSRSNPQLMIRDKKPGVPLSIQNNYTETSSPPVLSSIGWIFCCDLSPKMHQLYVSCPVLSKLSQILILRAHFYELPACKSLSQSLIFRKPNMKQHPYRDEQKTQADSSTEIASRTSTWLRLGHPEFLLERFSKFW